MKDNDKNKELSYLEYWDINNLHGWAMSRKLPGDGFKWVEETSQFNENFIKTYNEDTDEGHFFEVDVQYPEKIHELHNDLPFLTKRMKIEKVKKLVAEWHDKKCVIHIRNLKQVPNHGLESLSSIKKLG